MIKILKSKDFTTSLLFALAGLIASAFAAIYQLQMLSPEMQAQVIAQLGSVTAMIPIAALQGLVLTFMTALIGIKVAKKVNLTLNFTFDKNRALLSAAVGLAVALVITLSDRFIFAAVLPAQITQYAFSPIYFITGLLYGGIIEEVLLRLFVMSLLVLILWKVFSKKSDSQNIPKWVYISAITLAAAIFAAGHLPVTFQTIGTSVPIIIRCFLLNGIGGIGFGYLYWRHGLSYAILAHAMTHVFMQAVFMPILF
ncbi:MULTISPECIES: CPBP family intramembrane glutamic endopeptidase [unclassified Fusibacter]|uniref:CPBP family intramembrane glutamic endopeptidase n=1 Tax=unclassified Fusibacter TaxID=2624464 RepID=UPI001013A519|nr:MULTISPECIES: CPBP family intramembrane glutamic endopeptidase [unclassified Fusibacter]MCK8060212.1 CPBP family intramembrane metalloprotease [Fusibacter sp. A2]NPE22352.1 CPBP family intramembrane metalloprotease [Fusibacter sp. A1]RXV61125.1 CPBP family intramembrane metalloprotease [Fusibacter sp. A1]